MKKLLISFAAVLMLAALASPAVADNWTGWITDDHCGAKGAKAGHESCAKKCVAGGGEYVLYNTSDEKLYKLDDQDLAAENLGHEVVVTGSLEGDTITVESIAQAEG